MDFQALSVGKKAPLLDLGSGAEKRGGSGEEVDGGRRKKRGRVRSRWSKSEDEPMEDEQP